MARHDLSSRLLRCVRCHAGALAPGTGLVGGYGLRALHIELEGRDLGAANHARPPRPAVPGPMSAKGVSWRA
jgi:hypothetical protein